MWLVGYPWWHIREGFGLGGKGLRLKFVVQGVPVVAHMCVVRGVCGSGGTCGGTYEKRDEVSCLRVSGLGFRVWVLGLRVISGSMI